MDQNLEQCSSLSLSPPPSPTKPPGREREGKSRSRERCLRSPLWLLFFFFIWSSLHAQFETNFTLRSPAALANLIKQKFDSYQTYQAEFKVLYNNRLKLGRLSLKKPASFRLTFFKKGKLDYEIYVNEAQFHLYFPDYNLVYQEDLAKLPASFLEQQTPSPVLTLASHFDRYNFNFVNSSELSPIFNAQEKKLFNVLAPSPLGFLVSLTPKQVEQELDKMQLWVSPSGELLRSRTTTFKQETIDFYFYRTVVNPPLKADEFVFLLPAEAQVFKDTLVKLIPPAAFN